MKITIKERGARNLMNVCPRCGYPGKDIRQVSAGKAKKTLSDEERKRRSERLAAARLKRWPKKETT